MSTPTRGKKRLVVDVDVEVDSEAEVATAFSRLSVSIVAKPPACTDGGGKDVTCAATSGGRRRPSTCYTQEQPQSSTTPPVFKQCYTQQQPQSSTTPRFFKQCSTPPSVSLSRLEAVRSDLAHAIEKMQVVGKELKELAGDEIVDEPDTAKDVSVNFAMWRVYELAQSLVQEAQRLEDLEAGPSPPLSEYYYNDCSEDEDMGGGEWALDEVNYEEIWDRKRK